jgi:TonB family protein
MFPRFVLQLPCGSDGMAGEWVATHGVARVRGRARRSIRAGMTPGGILARAVAGVGLALAWVAPLAAQSRLYVLEPDGNYHQVLKASQGQPCILGRGSLVAAGGKRFALVKVEEYLPVLVTVHSKRIWTTCLLPPIGALPTPAKLNNEFHFSAAFESSCQLEEVFLVLELEFAGRDKNIFLYEVGNLEPGSPRLLSVDVPLEAEAGNGQCKLHLFVRGAEVFTSEQAAEERERMLDRMVSRRIASVQQAEPKPFFVPAPEYPPALRKSAVRGQAVVSGRVTPQGAVLDAVVGSASDPLFGEAALAAMRQSRFLPRVRDGHAVEAQVRMPFDFAPPKAPDAQKD